MLEHFFTFPALNLGSCPLFALLPPPKKKKRKKKNDDGATTVPQKGKSWLGYFLKILNFENLWSCMCSYW